MQIKVELIQSMKATPLVVLSYPAVVSGENEVEA